MKKLIMVIIFITIKAVSFAQEEASYYANKDDILYKYYYSDSSERNGEVYKGEPIISIEGELNIVSSADKKQKELKYKRKIIKDGCIQIQYLLLIRKYYPMK